MVGELTLSVDDLVVPRLTKPIFATMISGLAAGIVAAAAIVMALFVLVSIPSGSVAGGFFGALVMSSPIMLTGLALALFPIGPLWLVIAWVLVRHDTRSVGAYAVAGAGAATGMPFSLATWALAFLSDGAAGWLVFFAWFAASGAIGGAYAGAGIVALLRERSAPAG